MTTSKRTSGAGMLKATKPLPTTDQLKQASADAWADRYRRFEADMAQEHAKAPTPAKPDTSANGN